MTYPNVNKVRDNLLNKHYISLITYGKTTCDSPLIRKLLYDKLYKNKYKFISNICGYTSGTHSLNSNTHKGVGYSPKRLMSWIRLGKILKQDCIDGFEIYGGNTTIDEIELIFNKYISKETRYSLIDKICCTSNKYTLFDYCALRKTIKIIQLICDCGQLAKINGQCSICYSKKLALDLDLPDEIVLHIINFV